MPVEHTCINERPLSTRHPVRGDHVAAGSSAELPHWRQRYIVQGHSAANAAHVCTLYSWTRPPSPHFTLVDNTRSRSTVER